MRDKSLINKSVMGNLSARVVKHGQRRKVEGLVPSGPRVQITSLAPISLKISILLWCNAFVVMLISGDRP